MFTPLLLVTSLALFVPSNVRADELPEDLPDHVKERIRELPEEIRERIIEEIKRRSAAAAEAESNTAEADTDEAEKPADDEEEKPADESTEEGEKEEKSPEDELNERLKKLKAEMSAMETEFQYKVAKYKQELEDQRFLIEKLKLDNQLETQLREQQDTEQKEAIADIKKQTELLLAEAKLKKAELDAELAQYAARKSTIDAQIAAASAEKNLDSVVLEEESYPDQPFKNGVLHVSDRRIELNGPIFTGAAKYVCDRIDFFNNQSDKPIFLIIDSSPGGSGMEGLQIVQAIQNSDAPIHVVVKRYAASMAAIITTLADHSYAYPDAIILHHQASALLSGNTTVMKEDLERIREMSARLVGEVADKIGLESEQAFVELMYENRSSGDWDLFATEAVEQGWVDNIVNEIREESVRKRPTGSRNSGMLLIGLHKAPANEGDRYEVQLTEEMDDKGQPFVRLPRIAPLDAWFLYNPDGYYR